MPRNGSGIFTAPFPEVMEETTIDSAVHNGTVADFVSDANNPRPIIAGGTGANNAATARTNLQAEVAMTIVTNYDSHIFESGSFSSDPAVGIASGAPIDGQYLVGTCTLLNVNNICLEVRAISTTPITTFSRWKVGGVWGAWIKHPVVTANGIAFQGAAGATITLRKNGSGNSIAINCYNNTLARWALELGDGVAESGGNAGSNFALSSFSDAGGFLGSPLTINRASGAVALTGALSVGGVLSVAGALNITGAIGSSGQVTGALGVRSNVWVMSDNGTYYFDSGSVKYLNWNGVNHFQFQGGGLAIASAIASTNAGTGALIVGGGAGIGGKLNVADTINYLTLKGGAIGTTSLTVPDRTLTNIVLYDNGATNWAGIGADTSGHVHIVTGTTAPATRIHIAANGVVTFGPAAFYTKISNSEVAIGASGVNSPQLLYQQSGSTMFTTGLNIASGLLYYDADASHGVVLAQNSNAWAAMSDARLEYKRTARDITDHLPPLDHFRIYERTDGKAIEIFAKAQEVDALFPQIVQRGSDDLSYVPTGIADPQLWCMTYDRMGALALAYLRQHAARLDAIEAQFATPKRIT